MVTKEEVLSVRMTKKDKRVLQEHALQEGIGIGEYVRRAALRNTITGGRVLLVRDVHTGTVQIILPLSKLLDSKRKKEKRRDP